MALVRYIRRFPDVTWDWELLSIHPEVKLQTLVEFEDREWNWTLLISNRNFVWLWVQTFPDRPWNWKLLSESTRFNWSWVREFPNKPWDWNTLSDKIEGMSTISEFPDKPWNWYKLTMSSETSIHDILETPNKPWTINELLFTEVDEEIIKFLRLYRSHYDADAWCDHTSRTPWKLIKANLDLPWNLFFLRIRDPDEFLDEDIKYLYSTTNSLNWMHLSEALDFKRIISKCPDRPWNFAWVSLNKTVSCRDVENFPEIKWNYNVIRLDDEKREWNAANVIKKYWKKAVTDPAYVLCKKIILGDLLGISIGGNDICDDARHAEVHKALG